MGSVKPITPNEVIELKGELIPDAVIKAFNALIAENWDGTSSEFPQNKVVAKIKTLYRESGNKISSEQIFEKRYLDIEGIYKKSGWLVDYDKPGFNESYEPVFTFKRRGTGR